ncbi:MAG: DNA-deoxyinosine glycosylase [Lachnospiraceae bacterium]|nr:DNA-deoxyinosine glycosylase [Lachnospiraceae bacterium]
MEYQKVTHEFVPVYDEHSRILILGSLPSVKSREQGFYYGHSQNRFWRVVAQLTGEAVPQSIPEKKALLLNHGIAVWDVIQSCEIMGSSDSSIRNVKVNDFDELLSKVPDIRIFANGGKAYELYQKYAFPQTGRVAVKLPSTSPANAAWSLEKLCDEWSRLLEMP